VLDSPGGDVQEAFSLSDVVVRAVLDTATHTPGRPITLPPMHQNVCVSACFLVWVAGADRAHWSFGKFGLGLHRPYFAPETYAQQDAGTAAQQQQESFIRVRTYLRRFEVPDALIDTMMTRSSREIYWLSSNDDSSVMSGRAPWFEELMIARCKYDPAFARDENAAGGQEIVKTLKQPTTARWNKYLEWRHAYNSCEYAFRQQSLQNLLASR
jgi:hypothetical protein